MKDDELTFNKAVEMAMETEDAAKLAKETIHGSKPSTTTPVFKLKKSGQQHGGRSGSGGKSRSPFQKGMCPRCGKTDHIAKDCRFINTTCYFCLKKGTPRSNLLKEEE